MWYELTDDEWGVIRPMLPNKLRGVPRRLGRQAASDHVVTVLPVPHTPPRDPDLAVEIPALTKRHVLTEANRFVWPGPDLRPARQQDAASVAYGLLPFGLFQSPQCPCPTPPRIVSMRRAKRSSPSRRWLDAGTVSAKPACLRG
jgi:hypothetical protein